MPRLINLKESDVLADVLNTFKLRGRIFCVSELSAPWSLNLAAGEFAHFHVIERGGAWIKLKGAGKAIPLAAGDLVIIPHGKGHTISDSPQTRPVPMKSLIRSGSPACTLVRHGGGGAETLMTCGSFLFEPASGNPLLALLPPLLHIRGSRGRMAAWLEATLKMLADEARHPRHGSEMVLSRLIDVVFVQALREWIEDLPPDQGGWLGALRDRQIGAALSLMHREPARAWSVAELAKEVSMSRSPFAAKFTALVGEPPLTYLTRWRMHVAAELLSDGEHGIKEVATRVGYEAETAFSKAFKRVKGMAPLNWRRKLQAENRMAA